MMEGLALGLIGLILFFVLGTLPVIGIVLLFDLRTISDYWLLIPIISGILGFYFFAGFEIKDAEAFASKFVHKNDRSIRIVMSIIIVWLTTCAIYFTAFYPFGSWWDDEEWAQFFAVVIGPPLLTVLAAILFKWAIKK